MKESLEPKIEKITMEMLSIEHIQAMVRVFVKDGYRITSITDRQILMKNDSNNIIIEMWVSHHTPIDAIDWLKNLEKRFNSGIHDLAMEYINRVY